MNYWEQLGTPHFCQQKDHFKVTFALQRHEPSNCLKIQLFHQTNSQTFQKTISQKYIDSQPQMTNLIDDPQYLYSTLVNQFNQLNISDNGSISFYINSGKKPKNIVIQTEKNSVDKIRQQLICKLVLLTTQMGTVNSENQNLRKELKQIKQQFHQSQEQIKKLKQSLNLDLVPVQHYGNRKLFVGRHGNTFSVKHVFGNALQNFVGNFEISLDKVTSFKIKIISLNQHFFGVGLGTKQMFGNTTYCHKEFLNLSYAYSIAYEYGKATQLGDLDLKNGDVIDFTVDRTTNIVTWLTNGKTICQCALLDHFKTDKLYLILGCYYLNDEFELTW